MRKRFPRPSRFALLAVVCLAAGCAAAGSTAAGSTAAPTPARGAAQIYEVRTYTTHPDKLDDLHRRFRDHTLRLFEKHGMTNVGYWVPQDSARSQNTLIYILSYPSRADRDRSWTAFLADPEWVAARTASEADGPILVRVESVFMTPTEYSPMR